MSAAAKKTVKAEELAGNALAWAVAQCEGTRVTHWNGHLYLCETDLYDPTTDGRIGILIIEREKIGTGFALDGSGWLACANDLSAPIYTGSTMLVAAMRCHVATKMGDTVEIPEELL